MVVMEVWGMVQGGDVLPIARDGDDWFFPTPPGMLSGTLICEFWAEDEAGNIGYRAALITMREGAIKCWHWLDSGCDCIMLAVRRPISTMQDRPKTVMDAVRVRACDIIERPSCTLRPHICPASGD